MDRERNVSGDSWATRWDPPPDLPPPPAPAIKRVFVWVIIDPPECPH